MPVETKQRLEDGIVVVTETKYQTADGRFFDELEKAREYQQHLLKHVRAFLVHRLDRATLKLKPHGFIMVHALHSHRMLAEYWCQTVFGPRVVWERGSFRVGQMHYEWDLEEAPITPDLWAEAKGLIEDQTLPQIWKGDQRYFDVGS